MSGRARYAGPVALDLEINASKLDSGRNLLDYESGVMDTLDGSHGATFTYLPIVYEDDAQVVSIQGRIVDAPKESYRLRLEFLPEADSNKGI